MKESKLTEIWTTGLNAALGNLIFSYNLAVFTSSQPSVASSLAWGNEFYFWVAVNSALLPFGALLGTLASGRMGQVCGHRQNLMFADLLTVVASFVTILPFTATFAVGRFLSGIAMGVFSMHCPLYINEFSPAWVSGRIGSLMMILSCVGSTLALGLALVLPVQDYDIDPMNNFWRFMFTLQGLFALIQLFFFLTVFTNESPFWLLKQGQMDQALTSLKFTYTEPEAKDLIEKMKNSKSIRSKDSVQALKLCILINILQQLSGVNAILSYATSLLSEYGSDLFIARVFVMATGLIRFVSSLGNIGLIDSVGRKKVLVIGTVLLGFCLCLMGIFDYFSVNFVLPIIVVQVYLAIFVMSSGPICWIYCGEVLSDQGMTLCTAVNFVSNVIVVLIFPFLKEWVGYTTVFLVLGVVNFVGAGMLQGMMKETKGLMKDEIRDLFGKGKNYE